MSRKTTARRGAISVLAATAIVPGFALGIADAAANSPAIAGLSVSAVKASTPSSVAITGKNLDNVGEIAFGLKGSARGGFTPLAPSAYIIVSPTKIVAELPSIVATGTYELFVAEDTDQSADTVKDDFVVTSLPTTSGSNLGTGPASTGQKLTVEGSGFLGTADVYFEKAGVRYPVRGFKVLSNDKLEVTTGELPVGANVLRVSNVAGSNDVTTPGPWTYTAVPVLAKAAPSVVSEEGGDVVTISGSGLLGPVADGDVKFKAGGVTVNALAEDFVAVSHLELVVKSPAPEAFGVDSSGEPLVVSGDTVEVIVGASNTLSGYKPLLLTIAPKPSGQFNVPGVSYGNFVQEATITGRNLKGAKVTVGSTTATVKSISADGKTLVFRVPVNPKSLSLNLNAVSRDVTVSTKEGVAYIGKMWWNDSATVTNAAIQDGNLVITGTQLASVAASDIEVDGVALPAATKVSYSTNPAGTDVTEVSFPWTGAADSVSVKNAAIKKLAAAAVTDTVDRTVTHVQFTSVSNDPQTGSGTLVLTGSNLKDVAGSELTFTGHGAFKAVLTSSTLTSATYTLSKPFGADYSAPQVDANAPGVDNSSPANGTFTDPGDVAPKTRTAVTAPRSGSVGFSSTAAP